MLGGMSLKVIDGGNGRIGVRLCGFVCRLVNPR